MQDLLEAAKRNDEAALIATTRSLDFPEFSEWFAAAFGVHLGAQLAEQYGDKREGLPTTLASALINAVTKKWTTTQIRRVDKACDQDSLPEQAPVVFALARDVPLYEARLLHAGSGEGWVLWFFTYANNEYRYLSPLEMPLSPHVGPPAGGARLRVGGQVQQAKLLKQAKPKFPPDAVAARIQGTVRLSAVIGTDGGVLDLKLVSGHCLLAKSAIEAVKKWRYQPTLLNGNPVEVVTIIDVIYTLSR